MRSVKVHIAVFAALALMAAPASASELRSFDLPSPLVASSTPGGKLERGKTVPRVHVLLPDGYNPRRRYPVLYLLHGANGGSDTWLGGIDDLAKGLQAIVVMPDGGQFGMYTDWWNGGMRGGPAWASYHLGLLKQTIERRYAIRAGRRWHAIAGISMGGQGTLRYAGMLPGYFGSAAGFSAAIPDMQSLDAQVGISVLAAPGGLGVNYNAILGPPNGAYAEGNSPQALAANYADTRLYLTSGNGINCPQDPIRLESIALDTVTESRINAQQPTFAAATRRAGADVTEVTTCGVHTFGVWDRAFAAARSWGLFEPVPEAPRRWTYRTVARAGEMWDLRFRFAQPPAGVVQFKRSGRSLHATGAGTVQLRGRQRGCGVTWKLPFDRRLPRACERRGR